LKSSVIFMPDQVLGAVEQTVKSLAKRFKNTCAENAAQEAIPTFFQDAEPDKNAAVIVEPRFDWPASIAMTRRTLENINPGMAHRFDEAIRKGWISKRDGLPGESKGTCTRVVTMTVLPQ
jgi:hypothetical protein